MINLIKYFKSSYLSESELEKACKIFSKLLILHKIIIYQNFIFIV